MGGSSTFQRISRYFANNEQKLVLSICHGPPIHGPALPKVSVLLPGDKTPVASFGATQYDLGVWDTTYNNKHSTVTAGRLITARSPKDVEMFAQQIVLKLVRVVAIIICTGGSW